MDLCRYNKIFGETNKGLYSYRIYDIAIIDVFLTFLLAYVIHRYNKQYSFVKISLILFVLGIVLHRMFCVKTTVDKLIFG